MTLEIKHGCTKSNPCSLCNTQHNNNNNNNNGDNKQQVDQPSQGVGADQTKKPENDQKNGDRFKYVDLNATVVTKVVKIISGDGSSHPGDAWQRVRPTPGCDHWILIVLIGSCRRRVT
jgi:hypothetical protein